MRTQPVSGPSFDARSLPVDPRAALAIASGALAVSLGANAALILLTGQMDANADARTFAFAFTTHFVACLAGVTLAGAPVFERSGGHFSVLLRVFSLGTCAAFLLYWVLPFDWLYDDIHGHPSIRLSSSSVLVDGVFYFAVFGALEVLLADARLPLRWLARAGLALAAVSVLVEIARATGAAVPIACLPLATMTLACVLLAALARANAE